MSMEHNNIRDKMKNPLLDSNEDIFVKPFQHVSFFEKLGLISALIISIFILVFSGFSLFVDFFMKSDYLYTLIDLSIIVMCIGAVYFVFNAFKRRIITDVLIDTAFQEGVYAKLLPLIENIAQTHVDSNIILDRISNIDLKVQNIMKERSERDIKSADFMQEPLAIGTSIKFAIKSIFLMTITMAAFLFLLNFTIGGITSYAVLLIFIMWWGFITNEYNLWKESSAWAMVFLPILVVPVSIMVLSNLLGSNYYNVLMAILYLSVGLYTLVYYLWAIYASTGSLPFIVTKKQQPVVDGFFALQQKGMLKELSDALTSHLEQRLQKDKKSQESEYAWKK